VSDINGREGDAGSFGFLQRLLSEQNYKLAFWQNRNESIAARKKRTKCNNCGRIGHWARECRSKRDGANAASGNRARDNQLFMASENPTTDTGNPVRDDTYIDSGASQHYFRSALDFIAYRTMAPQAVYLGNDVQIPAIGVGTVEMEIWNGGSWVLTRIQDALHVPEMTKNLVSVRKLTDRGITVKFTAERCRLMRQRQTVGGASFYSAAAGRLRQKGHAGATAQRRRSVRVRPGW